MLRLLCGRVAVLVRNSTIRSRKRLALVLSFGLALLTAFCVASAPTGEVIEFGDDEECAAGGAILSADGKTLVTRHKSDQSLRLWDVQTRTVRAVVRPEMGRGASALSPDTKTSVSVDNAKATMNVWDVSTGKDLVVLRGHEPWIWDVVFSPDSKMLASSGADYKIRVWDLPSGKEIAVFSADCTRGIAFSPDGKLLAACCRIHHEADKVKIWNIAERTERASFGGSIEDCQCLAFSPDGKTLAVADAWGGSTVGVRGHECMGARLFDVATGQERLVDCPSVSGDFPRDYDSDTRMYLAFSPNGKYVAVGNQWTIGLWDVSSGKNTASFGFGGARRLFPRSGGCLTRLKSLWCSDHSPEIMFVTFTAEGKLLAFGDAYDPEGYPPTGKLVVWAVTTARVNE